MHIKFENHRTGPLRDKLQDCGPEPLRDLRSSLEDHLVTWAARTGFQLTVTAPLAPPTAFRTFVMFS